MCVRVCVCTIAGGTMFTRSHSSSPHPTLSHPLIPYPSHPLTLYLHIPSHPLTPHTPSPVLAPSSSPSSSSEELSSPITRPTPVDRMERPEMLDTRTRPTGSKLSSRRGWGEGEGREEEGGFTVPCEEYGDTAMILHMINYSLPC